MVFSTVAPPEAEKSGFFRADYTRKKGHAEDCVRYILGYATGLCQGYDLACKMAEAGSL